VVLLFREPVKEVMRIVVPVQGEAAFRACCHGGFTLEIMVSGGINSGNTIYIRRILKVDENQNN
jgi:hypothetical protein